MSQNPPNPGKFHVLSTLQFALVLDEMNNYKLILYAGLPLKPQDMVLLNENTPEALQEAQTMLMRKLVDNPRKWGEISATAFVDGLDDIQKDREELVKEFWTWAHETEGTEEIQRTLANFAQPRILVTHLHGVPQKADKRIEVRAKDRETGLLDDIVKIDGEGSGLTEKAPETSDEYQTPTEEYEVLQGPLRLPEGHTIGGMEDFEVRFDFIPGDTENAVVALYRAQEELDTDGNYVRTIETAIGRGGVTKLTEGIPVPDDCKFKVPIAHCPTFAQVAEFQAQRRDVGRGEPYMTPKQIKLQEMRRLLKLAENQPGAEIKGSVKWLQVELLKNRIEGTERWLSDDGQYWFIASCPASPLSPQEVEDLLDAKAREKGLGDFKVEDGSDTDCPCNLPECPASDSGDVD